MLTDERSAPGHTATPVLERWWVRSVFGLSVVAYWFGLARIVWSVSEFARGRDGTLLEAGVWAAVSAAGFGVFAALLLIRTRGGKYLVPWWACLPQGLLCFASSALIFVLYAERDNPRSLLGPSAEVWAMYLINPVTVAVIVLAMVSRHVPRIRTAAAYATLVVAIAPWPLLLIAIVQRGCC